MKRGSTTTVVTALAVISMALSGEAFSLGSLSLSLPRAEVARAASSRPCSGILAASMSSVIDSRKASMVGQRACAAEATRTRRPNGYWKVFENVEAELLAVRIPAETRNDSLAPVPRHRCTSQPEFMAGEEPLPMPTRLPHRMCLCLEGGRRCAPAASQATREDPPCHKKSSSCCHTPSFFGKASSPTAKRSKSDVYLLPSLACSLSISSGSMAPCQPRPS